LEEELAERLKAAEADPSDTRVAQTVTEPTLDSSLMNNVLLLGATALLAYLVYAVLKNTGDYPA